MRTAPTHTLRDDLAAALNRARARWLRWRFADAILRGDDLTASHLGAGSTGCFTAN